jgi:hypothetical protein
MPHFFHWLSWRLILAGIVIAGALAGLSLLYYWYVAIPRAEEQALQVARARWEMRSFDSYRLRVEQTSYTQPGMVEAYAYTVRSEMDYVARSGVEGKSITEFFQAIDTYPRTNQFRCAQINGSCAFPETYRVRAVYDEQIGYPQQIKYSRIQHPEWFNARFWFWLWQSDAWRDCSNLLCTSTSTKTVTITSLKDIP